MKEGKLRITARIIDTNPVHSRFIIWVNGGEITNGNGICLRNEEVEEFMRRLDPSWIEVPWKDRIHYDVDEIMEVIGKDE